jgi:hypothetical protein
LRKAGCRVIPTNANHPKIGASAGGGWPIQYSMAGRIARDIASRRRSHRVAGLEKTGRKSASAGGLDTGQRHIHWRSQNRSARRAGIRGRGGGRTGIAVQRTERGLFVPGNPIAGWPKFTIEVLFLPETNCADEQRFVYITDDDGNRATLETRSADGLSWRLDTCLWSGDNPLTLRDPDALHPNGKWTWAALVYDGETMSHYVNGVKELEGGTLFAPMTGGQVSLGVRNDRRYWFKGGIKEVRFIPEALDSNALQRVLEKQSP